MRLTYLIGVPGVGKSTLLNALTDGLPGLAATRPFARTIYDCGVVQLGAPRAAFGGTDTLSMSVQPKVLEWAEMPDYPDIVGEGDRLANGKFFSAMRDLGYELCVVHCHAPDDVVSGRRLSRAEEHGLPPQDATWVQGRVTKYARLADEWATDDIDMQQPVEHLAPLAARLPVLDTLWRGRGT